MSAGCIPVVVANQLSGAFASLVPYSKFLVRIEQSTFIQVSSKPGSKQAAAASRQQAGSSKQAAATSWQPAAPPPHTSSCCCHRCVFFLTPLPFILNSYWFYLLFTGVVKFLNKKYLTPQQRDRLRKAQ